MAEMLETDQSTYSKYEKTILEYNNKILKKLSKYFDVSSDYLLDLKEDY